jgi:hypothetical protein
MDAGQLNPIPHTLSASCYKLGLRKIKFRLHHFGLSFPLLHTPLFSPAQP